MKSPAPSEIHTRVGWAARVSSCCFGFTSIPVTIWFFLSSDNTASEPDIHYFRLRGFDVIAGSFEFVPCRYENVPGTLVVVAVVVGKGDDERDGDPVMSPRPFDSDADLVRGGN